MQFSKDRVRRLAAQLSPLRLKRLFQAAGSSDETSCDEVAVCLVGFANLLASDNTFTELEQLEIEDHFGPKLCELVPKFSPEADNSKILAVNLAIIDGRYVAMSGENGFLDVKNGKFVEKLTQAPIKTVTYNLVSVHHRNIQAILAAEGEKDHVESTG